MVYESLLGIVKDYAKVSEDDTVLLEIAKAAKERCENETGKEFDLSRPLCAQAIRMITLDWSDHRGTTTTENLKELPMSTHVQNILNHIAISTDYPEVKEVSE